MSEQTYEFIKFLVSVISPLIAGYIGVRYGLKKIKIQKELDFIEKQLQKFYSPLLGIHKEIKAKSELRLKIEKASHEVWQEKNKRGGSPDITPVKDEINYNNQQLKNEFMPQYNQMLSIFKENYWLAEPETKNFYFDLVEFVEVWNRSLKDEVQPEVIEKIGHTEKNLHPFYKELETRTGILRNKKIKS